MQRLPAPSLFVVGALSQYAGAAAAVLLFAQVPAAGVAWLRVLAAAVVVAAWRRPWRALLGASPRRLLLVAGFGTVLALMNTAFYLAIDELPLGTAVAIEFLGPISVAAAGTRSRRDLAAFGLAVTGVVLLADIRLVDGRLGSAPGVAFALLAAALWAGYIVLGSRVAAAPPPGIEPARDRPLTGIEPARDRPLTGIEPARDRSLRGVDGLAGGLLAGAIAVAPFGAPRALPALADPRLLAVCLAVGVLSSVVPYALDQVVLSRMDAARFALLLALLPATAATVGALVLRQVPSPLEAIGIGLVVAAVAVRTPDPGPPASSAAEKSARPGRADTADSLWS